MLDHRDYARVPTIAIFSAEDRISQTVTGGAYAIGAFLIWGAFPLYFKAVAKVPAIEVLSHRIVWSVVFTALLLVVTRHWNSVKIAFGNRRLLLTLTGSALLISVNWLIFIWAVAKGYVLEASLGYFISPIVNVLLGFIFIGERLRRWQWVAVGLAAVAVGDLVIQAGSTPWIALALALTFGLYGLVRKVAEVEAIPGFFIETIILCPPALAYLLYLGIEGGGKFGVGDHVIDGLLAMAGVITGLPLILFAKAAKRLRLATVGFFQYITPSAHFVIAVFIFDEPFTGIYMITFSVIWLALVIYTADTVWAGRSYRNIDFTA